MTSIRDMLAAKLQELLEERTSLITRRDQLTAELAEFREEVRRLESELTGVDEREQAIAADIQDAQRALAVVQEHAASVEPEPEPVEEPEPEPAKRSNKPITAEEVRDAIRAYEGAFTKNLLAKAMGIDASGVNIKKHLAYFEKKGVIERTGRPIRGGGVEYRYVKPNGSNGPASHPRHDKPTDRGTAAPVAGTGRRTAVTQNKDQEKLIRAAISQGAKVVTATGTGHSELVDAQGKRIFGIANTPSGTGIDKMRKALKAHGYVV